MIVTKPVVYHFNPTCELAIANNKFSYNPPQLLQKMEDDLSILPFIFANSYDIVLSKLKPTARFLTEINELGFELPTFYNIDELELLPENSFKSLNPWGWSNAEHFLFKNLKNKCEEYFKNSPVYNWNDEYKLLFERSSSLSFLNSLLDFNETEWFINKTQIGKIVTETKQIEELLKTVGYLVLKAPLSSSGRGIQIIRDNKLNTSNLQWINGIFKQQKYIVAEPYLNKVLDFSFQFSILSNSEVEYHGISVFETNTNGQYKSSVIRPNLKNILKQYYSTDIENRINKTAAIHINMLETTTYPRLHRGYFGIDSMIFISEGKLLIQPCIEINCRMNMGILTKKIESKVSNNSIGRFELFYGKENEYLEFVKAHKSRNPPIIKSGFLDSGFISLTEPQIESKFGAYVILDGSK